MPIESYDVRQQFERGVVILSLDTEQIWGYLDLLNETQFRNRYPDAQAAHEKVLACLSNAGVSATWFMVGGMALHGSDGARDRRMAGLPVEWTEKIPAGIEATAPLGIGRPLWSACAGAPFPGDRASWGADSSYLDRSARDPGGGEL